MIESTESLLSSVKNKTVVLVGDFCLDVYYHISSADLEPSLETGLMVRRVHKLTTSLGGGGNVFANLCALGTGTVIPVGVIGPDMFGIQIQQLMKSMNPSSPDIAVQGAEWVTPAYMKPILDGKEQERIDTGLRNAIREETVDKLLSDLRSAMKTADVVMINQQLADSIYTDRFIEGINALAHEYPQIPFIVDARTMQSRFHGMWHKLNTHEAAAEIGVHLDPMRSELPASELYDIMRRYYEASGDPVIISRGEYGAVAYDGSMFYSAEGLSLLTELDTVGAGDSFFSGFALALASGLSAETALHIGNAVAGVTVQKLNQTGTCSPDELRAIVATCDYTYNSDVQTEKISVPFEAEAITPFHLLASRPAVKYAVFDHDGTISVLRQGWEGIMEECMVDAVSGGGKCSSYELDKIRDYCRKFIVKSTGIQTISQMVMLVDIVRRWGIVPESEILTAKQYKDIYNDALLKYIDHRLRSVETGALSPEETTIEGSISLLRSLAQAGVKIYLASGTDIEDVKHEATILGYADCFTGGIFGSVGDVKNDPKRHVLRKILAEEEVNMDQLVIFGDGPVEMREARENGAIAFGVMSDEKKRSGWNANKRERLIHAGADILVPDFKEHEKITDFLLNR